MWYPSDISPIQFYEDCFTRAIFNKPFAACILVTTQMDKTDPRTTTANISPQANPACNQHANCGLRTHIYSRDIWYFVAVTKWIIPFLVKTSSICKEDNFGYPDTVVIQFLYVILDPESSISGRSTDDSGVILCAITSSIVNFSSVRLVWDILILSRYHFADHSLPESVYEFEWILSYNPTCTF